MSGGGGENTVGRAVHTLKARPEGVCVCLAPGALAGCALAEPPV